MKTITHILFIYLLFYNSALNAQPLELHVTFEVMNGTKEYKDVMLKAQQKYSKEGLNCYTANVKNKLSLRCNDTKNTIEYKKNIALLKSLNINYKVVSIEKYINMPTTYRSMVPPKLKPKPKSRYNLRDGYKAFNAQNYSKARFIFNDIYKYKKNLESSYAMALVALQEKKYIYARTFLDTYRSSSAKASKLYFDSIMSEYNSYVRVSNYKKAKEIISKYKRFYPKLRKLPTQPPLDLMSLGYKAYNQGEYTKAKRYFLANYKKRRDFESLYALSLVALKNSNFKQVRNYLAPYIDSKEKAKKLFYISIVNQYYTLTGNKKNKQALALQSKYIAKFPKLSTLIKPAPKYNLGQGYRAYNKGEYKKAKFVFSKLYDKEQNEENAYALSLVFLKNSEFIKVRSYLEEFIDSSDKSSKLYYDSIIQEYYGYLNQKRYLKAIDLIKEFKDKYPQLKDVNNALIAQANILIKQGEYYQAQELLKENDFEDSKGYVFNKVYDKAIKLRSDGRDITAVKLLIPYVPLYPKASQFFADVTYVHVGEHLKNKEYEKAKNLLKPLAATTPRAEEYYYKVTYEEILEKGWQNFKKHEVEKSLDFFEDACKISAQESCIEGIMQSAYKLKEYQKALFRAEELYPINHSQQAAFIAFDSNLKLKNKEGSEKWYAKLDSKRVALAKMQESINDLEYIQRHYIQALSHASGDFELSLQYLYFLKSAKFYDDFEHFMKDSLKRFLLTKQRVALKKVKVDYQHEKLYKYYSDAKYDSCYIYGNEVLNESDDIGYKKIHAWCAYRSEHYKEAEKMFEVLNLRTDKTRDDIFAQFISAYRAKHFSNAKKLLDVLYIESTTQSEKIEIAQYYISLNEQKIAQEITSQIVETKDREMLQRKINANYKYSTNRVNAFAGGVNYKNINIENGRHNFTEYYIPIDVDIYDESTIHYYVDADVLQLSDEFKGSPQKTSYEYGLGWFYDQNKLSAKTAFMANGGIKMPYLQAEIGTTPIGTDIQQRVTGKLLLHTMNEKYNLSLKVSRVAMDNSMISFVGDNLKDLATNENVEWGRVVKSGAELELSYNAPLSLNLNVGYYPKIEGYRVMDNSQKRVSASLTYSLPTKKYAYLDYSFLGVFDTYKKNSDFFTYGHGGYFSPQRFYLANFATDIASNISSTFYVKAKASVGYQYFKVDGADKFPIKDSRTKGLSGSFSGYTKDGLIYKLNLASGIKIANNLNFIGAFSYETMGTYNVAEATLSFVYYFGKGKKVNLYNFKNGHRIAQ